MIKHKDPYPGLRSFTEDDRDIFFGRDSESKLLTQTVLSERCVLLYARSGLGKTSLIQAGLLGELRLRGFFPVVVRVSRDEHPIQSVIRQVGSNVSANGYKLENGEYGSLWDFFFHSIFKKGEERLHPVLILDQFEELFTIVRMKADGRSNPEVEFIDGLAEILGEKAPLRVQASLLEELDQLSSNSIERRNAISVLYEGAVPDVKVLISMREDYLPELDGLQKVIPGIFKNSMRLSPLSVDQAREAIVKPSEREAFGFEFEPHVVDEMIDFLGKRKVQKQWIAGETIEPYVLQILCQRLNESLQTRDIQNRVIKLSDLGGEDGMRQITRQHYSNVLRGIPRLRIGWNAKKLVPTTRNFVLLNRPRYSVQKLCESGLITPTGFRNSLAEAVIEMQYCVPKSDLEVLQQKRLVRREARLESSFYELTHDTWLTPLLKFRTSRRRRRRWSSLIVMALVISSVLPLFQSPSVNQLHPQNTSLMYIGWQWLRARTLISVLSDSTRPKEARVNALIKLSDSLKWNNLQGIRFRQIPLKGQKLNDIDLSHSILTMAYIWNSSFGGCNLQWADLDSANLYRTAISTSDLSNSNLNSIRMSVVTIVNSSLNGAWLRDAIVPGVTFDSDSLVGAHLTGANLNNTFVGSCDLVRAELSNSELAGAMFRSCDLSQADLSNSRLERALFDSTKLEGANFHGADWWQAYGWTKEQLSYLKDHFPLSAFGNSARQNRDIDSLTAEVTKAPLGIQLAAALNNLAWYRTINGGDLHQALEEITKALRLTPNLGNAIDTKGYILLIQGKYPEAQLEFEKSISSRIHIINLGFTITNANTNFGDRIYHLALALEKQGDTASARIQFDSASRSRYYPTYERLLTPSDMIYAFPKIRNRPVNF